MFTFLKSIFCQDKRKTPNKPTSRSSKGKEPHEGDEEVWIGVDLDGTLAYFDSWQGLEHIGKPVPTMEKRVLHWIEQGHKVKILTARASLPGGIPPVERWLKKHKFPPLEVTNAKDFYMLELWDDRAVQVIPNMGKPVISPSVLSLPRAPLLEMHAPERMDRS
jgi:hypothetical protein